MRSYKDLKLKVNGKTKVNDKIKQIFENIRCPSLWVLPSSAPSFNQNLGAELALFLATHPLTNQPDMYEGFRV